MKKFKLFIMGIILVSGFMTVPGFAVELNATNVLNYCNILGKDSDWLDCNDSGVITSVAGDTFQAYSTIVTRIYLDANQINLLNINAFSGLANLEYLYLNNNAINSIQTNLFQNLSNLKYLYLENNNITSIDNGDFNGLTSIDELYLNNNHITTIGVNSFNGLSELDYLYLNDNQISSIEYGDFNGLTSIDELYLNNNNITEIGDSAFSGLINGAGDIDLINLESNQISSIDVGDFDGISDVKEINISHNNICFIETGALDVGLVGDRDIFDARYNYLDENVLSADVVSFLDSRDGRDDWRTGQTPEMCETQGGCTDSSNPDATRLCFRIIEGTNTCTWNETSYSFGSYNVTSSEQHTGINSLGFSCELYANAGVTITLSDADFAGDTYTIDASNLTGDASDLNFTEDGSLTAGASWTTNNSQMTSQELYSKTQGQIGNIIQYFDIDLTVPAGQPADSYTANLTITISN